HTAFLSRVSRHAGGPDRAASHAAFPSRPPHSGVDHTDSRALPVFHPVERLAGRRHALRPTPARPRPVQPAPLPSLVPARALLRCVESPAGTAQSRGPGLGEHSIPERWPVRAYRTGTPAPSRGVVERRLARCLRSLVRALSLFGERTRRR